MFLFCKFHRNGLLGGIFLKNLFDQFCFQNQRLSSLCIKVVPTFSTAAVIIEHGMLLWKQILNRSNHNRCIICWTTFYNIGTASVGRHWASCSLHKTNLSLGEVVRALVSPSLCVHVYVSFLYDLTKKDMMLLTFIRKKTQQILIEYLK